MTIQCVRKIEWCSGHRLLNHEGKCAHLHGHNYEGHFYVEGEELDSVGRVIDFSVVKERIKHWIDSKWDHKFILNFEDREAIQAVRQINGNNHLFLLDSNPTAENMAETLLSLCNDFLFRHDPVKVVRIRLYETPNCYVEVS